LYHAIACFVSTLEASRRVQKDFSSMLVFYTPRRDHFWQLCPSLLPSSSFPCTQPSHVAPVWSSLLKHTSFLLLSIVLYPLHQHRKISALFYHALMTAPNNICYLRGYTCCFEKMLLIVRKG